MALNDVLLFNKSTVLPMGPLLLSMDLRRLIWRQVAGTFCFSSLFVGLPANFSFRLKKILAHNIAPYLAQKMALIMVDYPIFVQKFLMVITIGNTKGGVGKTTTAFHLCVWLGRQNKDVLLIDADDSATTASSIFTAHRSNCLDGKVGYTMLRLAGAELTRGIPKLRDKFDYIIIDTGATDSQSLRAALVVADWLIIPCQPTLADLWMTTAMVGKGNILGDVNAYRTEELKALTFVSMAKPNQNSGDVVEALERAGFKVLKEKVTSRKCFNEALKIGRTIFEVEEQDEAHGKAIRELNNLFEIILTHVNHEQESSYSASANC